MNLLEQWRRGTVCQAAFTISQTVSGLRCAWHLLIPSVCLTLCIWTKLMYGRTHMLHFKEGSYVSVWRMTCPLLVRNTLAGWAQRLMNVKITSFQEMDLMPRFLKGNCHLRGISFSESLLHPVVGFAQRQKRG